MDEDRLGVAICGCGRISNLMAQSCLKIDDEDEWDNAYIRAAIDPRREVAKLKAKEWVQQSGGKFEEIEIYTSLKQALKDSKLDIVIISTPESLHLEQTKLCLNADKHTSLQKVPAPNLREMDEIVELATLAKKRGVKFHVFENFRHHLPYIKMKEVLDSGVCGELKSVFYKMISSMSEPSQWKVPLSTIKYHMEQSNYSINTWDDGYHKHSLMRWWLGPITKVREWRGDYKIFSIARIDGPAVLQYKSSSGRYGLWSYSHTPNAPLKSDYYGSDEYARFDCSDGMIFTNGCTGNSFAGASACEGVGEPGVYWYDKNGKWHADCSMPTNWKYSFAHCGRYFVDETINGSGNASLSAEEARHILKINIALLNSYRRGFKEVDVQSTEKIEGKAKHMLPKFMGPIWKLIGTNIKKEN
jgi:predicted dehydrogenase